MNKFKFKVKKDILLNALSFTSIPLLSSNTDNVPEIVKNIYINCEKDHITFFGTNLKMLYEYTIQKEDEILEIDNIGKCLLYSKNLYNLIKKYSQNTWVNFEYKTDKNPHNPSEEINFVEITIGKSNQKIFCNNDSSYDISVFDLNTINNTIEINSSSFLQSIDKVLSTCGKNIDRYELFNICLQQHNKQLYFVSSSGFSLAVCNFDFEESKLNEQFLIRKDMIITDVKYYDVKNNITLTFGENNKYKNKKLISIEHCSGNQKFKIISTPIDLVFPAWEKFIETTEDNNRISVPKSDFLSILDRVYTLSPNFIILKSEDDKVLCSAHSQESIKTNNCNYVEEIDHLDNSLKGTFCVSTTLLKDGLKKINGDVIDFYLLNINGNNIMKIYSSINPSYKFFIGLIEESSIEDEEENKEQEED